ncbi:MAG: NUDIX hydrolase [Candidatus Nanopelagicales bacterium]
MPSVPISEPTSSIGPTPSPATVARSVRPPLGRVEETSAGGLVVDRCADPARAALIARHDRRGRLLWSLPKGHLEAGESAEQAAVREVAEETGITGRVLATLGTIDFWFVAEGRRVHKTVHHFLLEAVGGELSDADIEVVDVKWFSLDEVAQVLAYADERRLLGQVPGLLADTG